MNRRRFLTFLGLAPFVAAVPIPPPVKPKKDLTAQYVKLFYSNVDPQDLMRAQLEARRLADAHLRLLTRDQLVTRLGEYKKYSDGYNAIWHELKRRGDEWS